MSKLSPLESYNQNTGLRYNHTTQFVSNPLLNVQISNSLHEQDIQTLSVPTSVLFTFRSAVALTIFMMATGLFLLLSKTEIPCFLYWTCCAVSEACHESNAPNTITCCFGKIFITGAGKRDNMSVFARYFPVSKFRSFKKASLQKNISETQLIPD